MSRTFPSLNDILSVQDTNIQEVIQFIDIALQNNVIREELIKIINDDYWDDEDAWFYGMAYISYKFPGEYVSIDYDELIDTLRNLYTDESSTDNNDEYEVFDHVPLSKGYSLYCDVTGSKADIYVSKVLKALSPRKGKFLHIDLDISDFNSPEELQLMLSSEKGNRKISYSYNKRAIQLFHDGNHLHFPAIETTEFLEENVFQKYRFDTIKITIFRNGEDIGHYSFCLKPSKATTDANEDEPLKQI